MLFRFQESQDSIEALSLTPVSSKGAYGRHTVTAVKPNDFDAEEFRKRLKKEFGLSIAGGQGHLTGKIVRIGHMGYCSPSDVLQIIGMIEIGLVLIGKDIVLGKGTAAAQKIYLNKGAVNK